MEELLFRIGDPEQDGIRRWGYLAARYDPLGRIPPLEHPALAATSAVAQRLKSVYTGPLEVEFMHLPFPERCRWIAERMEAPAPDVDRTLLLEQLVRAEVFEQVLQTHYVGTKRFSLEGLAALIPLLHETIRSAAQAGATQAVIGMSHRGRLNVMVNLLGKSPREIFARFEDSVPDSVMGSGDVKYHLGAGGTLPIGGGRSVRLILTANPSHLEAVDPVVQGYARALQERPGEDAARRVLPLLLHGDAAIAGQGIASETFNLSGLPGYSVRGTVHVVLNNLIGFTTPPESLYS